MAKRLYPHNRVRYWWSYDLEGICDLFSDTKLHQQTIRKWIKEGLKVIDNKKPTLIYGYDLIAYLKKQNDKGKTKTAFDQFYCMSCKDARMPFQKKVSVIHKASHLQASAICQCCKTRMNKTYKLDDYQALRRIFQLGDVSQLYDAETFPIETHLSNQEKDRTNESQNQGELFS
ncbi:hypothetical protein [Curvivirga aplysinae]|uniref:hypothetical protein n=1 Tax=Curvivirga aplysinae TaxID=2529852 RepID=UPI0012BBBB54|nr:hypothetical protein [Curvivirga aplysinae]MTI08702.1 hypothetical protein [Curvivirga aplysinae]